MRLTALRLHMAADLFTHDGRFSERGWYRLPLPPQATSTPGAGGATTAKHPSSPVISSAFLSYVLEGDPPTVLAFRDLMREDQAHSTLRAQFYRAFLHRVQDEAPMKGSLCAESMAAVGRLYGISLATTYRRVHEIEIDLLAWIARHQSASLVRRWRRQGVRMDAQHRAFGPRLPPAAVAPSAVPEEPTP